MKNLTATILALAMLCAVSCKVNTTTPAETTAATTVGDGASTSREETTETTEPAPSLPEFDINSEECLMYRLLDMTYEEIEAEFEYGENLRYGGIGDSGNQTVYVTRDEAEYQLLFTPEDYRVEGSDSFEIPGDTKPSRVLLSSDSIKIWPGIDTSMTPKTLSEAVSGWVLYDINCYYIEIIKPFDNSVLCVSYSIDETESKMLEDKLKEKTEGEKTAILKAFADEFIQNMGDKSSNEIRYISLHRKDYKSLNQRRIYE